MIKILLPILFILYFLLSVPYYSGDVKNHLVWAKSIQEMGTMGFYERDFPGFAFPNYPPMAMFLFTFSIFLYDLSLQLAKTINILIPLFPSSLIFWLEWENVEIAFLKLPALMAVFGISVLIPNFLKLAGVKNDKLSSLALLINPAVVYITAVWGQIDLLPIFFFLFALLLLFKHNFLLSSVMIVLGLLSKQTIIVFLPLYYWVAFKNFGYKKTAISLLSVIVIFYLSYLPFHQFSFIYPFQLYRTNFNLVAESVGENAINFWGFLYDFKRSSDLEKFYDSSLQVWGYIAFGFLYSILMITFLRSKITILRLFEVLFLVNISYFLFLTRMHERYLVGSLVFLTILIFLSRKYLFFLVYFSFLHLLNLYRGLVQPRIYIFDYLSENILFMKLLVVGFIGFLTTGLYQWIKK